ncbi:MAG: hypothetical protein J6386_22990 [Candidatus Synoicihabitans palmerolidicus]|nr:hypothetical protein [Candidatus Synoicihabitans palmerolidicus]
MKTLSSPPTSIFSTSLPPPLDDVRVRRALSLAIDREPIVSKVTLGGQLPARNLTPPNTGGYTAGDLLTGDLAEAKRLLAEAGFPNGEGFPKLEILFNTNDGHRRIAEAIQQMWRSNLGIDIGLYNQEAKVQSDTMRQGDFQISRYAWIGDYVDGLHLPRTHALRQRQQQHPLGQRRL